MYLVDLHTGACRRGVGAKCRLHVFGRLAYRGVQARSWRKVPALNKMSRSKLVPNSELSRGMGGAPSDVLLLLKYVLNQ